VVLIAVSKICAEYTLNQNVNYVYYDEFQDKMDLKPAFIEDISEIADFFNVGIIEGIEDVLLGRYLGPDEADPYRQLVLETLNKFK